MPTSDDHGEDLMIEHEARQLLVGLDLADSDDVRRARLRLTGEIDRIEGEFLRAGEIDPPGVDRNPDAALGAFAVRERARLRMRAIDRAILRIRRADGQLDPAEAEELARLDALEINPEHIDIAIATQKLIQEQNRILERDGLLDT